MNKKQRRFLILHNNQKVVTRITKISDYEIEAVRKDIKNIHLGVYPPNGRIRISLPLRTTDDAMRLFIISKIPWIKKQRESFAKQERQTKRQFVSGESHYLFGKRYILNVHKANQKAGIQISKRTKLNFYVKPNSTITERQKIFENFYRTELEKITTDLITKWEEKVGVKTREVRIRKMKTRWGTCNSKNKRIWLNLELAKKSLKCIDYVFVHELVHLKERRHNERFIKILDKAYPKWRQSKEELNQGILSYFEWGCKYNPKLKELLN